MLELETEIGIRLSKDNITDRDRDIKNDSVGAQVRRTATKRK